jgi:hypothetical protein
MKRHKTKSRRHIAAAAGALMLRTSARPSGAAQSMAAAYGQKPETYSGAVRKTFDAAADAAQQTLDTATSYASAASDYADKARRTVGEQSERISRQTQSAASSILQNQPLAIVSECRGRRHSCGVSSDRP